MIESFDESPYLLRVAAKYAADAFNLFGHSQCEAFVLQEGKGALSLVPMCAATKDELALSLQAVHTECVKLKASAVILTLPGWIFRAHEQFLNPRVIPLHPSLSLYQGESDALAIIVQQAQAQWGAQCFALPGHDEVPAMLKMGPFFRGSYEPPFQGLLGEAEPKAKEAQLLDLGPRLMRKNRI